MSPVKLKRESGAADISVAAYMQKWLNENKNTELQMAWAEIDPTAITNNMPGRYQGFEPFVLGKPQWPLETPLLEARLFGDNDMLHIVKSDDGCRWVRTEVQIAHANESDINQSAPIKVLTLQDASRFGFSITSWPKNIAAIEYRQYGKLIAWRLITIKESCNG